MSGAWFDGDMPGPTPLQRSADRATERRYRELGEEIDRLRRDAGLTIADLSRTAGVDAGFLSRIVAGSGRPSLGTMGRISATLGADLSVRMYPNTGPAIRDRHQAAISEAILGIRHPRWAAFVEIAVRRPARGWIDLGLHDARAASMVTVEIESHLRRLEQHIRWLQAKADALPSWEGWAQLGAEPIVSRLLVVRDTRANRSIAADHRLLLRTAFPADPEAALAAVQGTGPWPGPALLWAVRTPDGPGYRLVARR